MNVKKFAFYSLFLLCFGFGLFLFNKIDSFALTQANIEYVGGGQVGSWYSKNNLSFDFDISVRRFAFYGERITPDMASHEYAYRIYTNQTGVVNASGYAYGYYWDTGERYNAIDQPISRTFFNYPYQVGQNIYANLRGSGFDIYSRSPIVTNIPVFFDMDDLVDYITNGTMPIPEYDETLKLDSFKVTSWAIGNLQALFKSKFDVKWSDSRISVVQVRITGTANDATYESSSSPFKGKFQADNFVFNRGDVIHLVATPFKANGSYGESLYYTVTYSDIIPFSNTYRKLVNNNVNDNTLTIPYIDTSGNNYNVTFPVDGVSTNITYKVNYNPVTNEYGDLNVYEIYYSPVVVYPDETTENEVDETQDIIINNYNTTNYYETVQDIDTNFDIDITDVSSGDIQNTYDDIGNFFKGFGSFVGKLALLFNGLFPFLSPTVSIVLVSMVGIIAVGAVVILFLKIFHII